jgi:hypothetical protein
VEFVVGGIEALRHEMGDAFGGGCAFRSDGSQGERLRRVDLKRDPVAGVIQLFLQSQAVDGAADQCRGGLQNFFSSSIRAGRPFLR